MIQNGLRVCGYILIDDDGNMYPIDIRDIAMLEGTFCLQLGMKQAWLRIICTKNQKEYGRIFSFLWQFMCDWNVFEDSGSFIEMCSSIIGQQCG